MTKPAYGICGQQRHKSACASILSNQLLCYSLPDSIMPTGTMFIISRLLSSVAEQSGLSLTYRYSQTSEGQFSHEVAHVLFQMAKSIRSKRKRKMRNIKREKYGKKELERLKGILETAQKQDVEMKDLYTGSAVILSFQTDMPGQTVQTQIRLFLEEQSDQSLPCSQTVQTQIRLLLLRSSLIRVYTVCHSVCIVWTH